MLKVKLNNMLWGGVAPSIATATNVIGKKFFNILLCIKNKLCLNAKDVKTSFE